MSLALAAAPASAADWKPSKPITILVGFSVGGAMDTAARLQGEVMSKLLGVPVLIRNVPGAGGRNSVTILNRAKPDGHTMAAINLPGQAVNQVGAGNGSRPAEFHLDRTPSVQPVLPPGHHQGGQGSVDELQADEDGQETHQGGNHRNRRQHLSHLGHHRQPGGLSGGVHRRLQGTRVDHRHHPRRHHHHEPAPDQALDHRGSVR